MHLEIQQEEIHLGQIVEQSDHKKNSDSNINGRGGKRESCGYLCASFGRSPDGISPSFYTVAILALAYLDSSCFDKSSTVHHGKKWFV